MGCIEILTYNQLYELQVGLTVTWDVLKLRNY